MDVKEVKSSPTTRLTWVDIAKGLAIILVIIGHTAPFGSIARNTIFSFHMPLFFLLSGYCTKQILGPYKIWNHIGKRCWKLFVPLAFIIIVSLLTTFVPKLLSTFAETCS